VQEKGSSDREKIKILTLNKNLRKCGGKYSQADVLAWLAY
jgi:hypothetical protein